MILLLVARSSGLKPMSNGKGFNSTARDMLPTSGVMIGLERTWTLFPHMSTHRFHRAPHAQKRPLPFSALHPTSYIRCPFANLGAKTHLAVFWNNNKKILLLKSTSGIKEVLTQKPYNVFNYQNVSHSWVLGCDEGAGSGSQGWSPKDIGSLGGGRHHT